MQRRCCWPPERPRADVVEPVLHLVPEGRAPERLLDALGHLGARAQAVDLEAVRHVLEDGLREGIRLLEHHPDTAAQIDHVHPRAVDVAAVEENLPVHDGVRDDVVHPVQAPQVCGLAAARRADESRDRLLRNLERDVPESLLRAVREVQLARLHPQLRRGRRGALGTTLPRGDRGRSARLDGSFHGGLQCIAHVRCILSSLRVTTLASTEKTKMNPTRTRAPAQACRCQSS